MARRRKRWRWQLALWRMQDGKCALCGYPMKKKGRGPLSMTNDHKTPLGAGGKDTKENVQLAHRFCNQRKGAGVFEHPTVMFFEDGSFALG